MKDNIIIGLVLTVFLLWQIVIAFGLWGEYPEGAFVKIEKLQAQLQEQANRTDKIETQFNEILGDLSRK